MTLLPQKPILTSSDTNADCISNRPDEIQAEIVTPAEGGLLGGTASAGNAGISVLTAEGAGRTILGGGVGLLAGSVIRSALGSLDSNNEVCDRPPE